MARPATFFGVASAAMRASQSPRFPPIAPTTSPRYVGAQHPAPGSLEFYQQLARLPQSVKTVPLPSSARGPAGSYARIGWQPDDAVREANRKKLQERKETALKLSARGREEAAKAKALARKKRNREVRRRREAATKLQAAHRGSTVRRGIAAREQALSLIHI